MFHQLGDTPMLETASPFATEPTVIQTNISEVKKATLSGLGFAFGAAIGAIVLFTFFGKKIR